MKTKFKVGQTYQEKGGMWNVPWVLESRRVTVSRNGQTIVSLIFCAPANASNYRKHFGNLRTRVRKSDRGEECNGSFYGVITA